MARFPTPRLDHCLSRYRYVVVVMTYLADLTDNTRSGITITAATSD